MLLRCASRLAAAPALMAAGVVVATGVAAGAALGVGVLCAAAVARRVREERKGWREGAEEPARDVGEVS